MNKHHFEISWGSLWKVLAIIAFAGVVFLVKDVLIMLLLAIIISAALDGPVDNLEKKKIPRVLGTLFIFLAVAAVLALVLYTVIPVALLEAKHLLVNLSKFEIPIPGLSNINVAETVNNLNQSLGNWANLLFAGDSSVFSLIVSISGSLLALIVVIVLSFYLTVDRTGVENFLRLILPVTYEEYVINIYGRVRKKLKNWLKGQLFLMFVVGAFVTLGLWILGVDYALLLGILAGIMEIVPIAGPIFSGILAFLIASPESLTLGIYVIALFVIIQNLENHVLIPTVMKKTIGISPVVVVIAILMGSKLAGLTGVVLAVPAAMVFQEILFDWEKYKFREKSHKATLI